MESKIDLAASWLAFLLARRERLIVTNEPAYMLRNTDRLIEEARELLRQELHDLEAAETQLVDPFNDGELPF